LRWFCPVDLFKIEHRKWSQVMAANSSTGVSDSIAADCLTKNFGAIAPRRT